MSDVFISYKTEDEAQARWVRDTLETNGISCWMAPGSIPGGSSYASEIPAAIRGCRAFVLVLSQQTQASRWVPRELDQAINCGKVVLPFMLEDCALRDDFNFYLTNVQRYNAYENKAAAMEKLLRDLRALLGADRAEAGKGSVPPRERENGAGEGSVPAGPSPEKGQAAPPKKAPAAGKPAKVRKAGKRRGCLRLAGMTIGLLAAVVLAVQLVGLARSMTIAGHRFARGEDVIYMSGKTLSEADWANLAKLKDLQYLTLIDCTLPEGELGGVLPRGLQRLELQNCGLTQSQYEGLKVGDISLYMLNLSENPQITDLGDLSALADGLTYLDVSGTGLADLNALEGFTGLFNLAADGVPAEDVSALAGCEGLEQLSLAGCELTDLTGLRGCPELEELNVNDNRLESLAGLENCLRLRVLRAENNQLTGLEGLENVTRLEGVYLSKNQLTDISALAKSAEYLQTVRLADNQLADLSALVGFTALVGLDIDRNQVQSLEPLAESKMLRGLSARDNKIGNTAGIEGLGDLQWLDLGGNPLTGVGVEKPLTFAPEREAVLDLTGARLEQADLQAEGGFRLLSLRDATAADWGFVYQQSGSRVVLPFSETLDLRAVGGTHFSECILLGCPADRQLDAADELEPCRLTLAPLGEGMRDSESYPYF